MEIPADAGDERHVSPRPHMDHREWNLLGLGWEIATEHFAEETVDDGVEPLVDESIPVLLGLPHIDVAQTAFRALDSEMHHQPGRRCIAEAVGDTAVEGVVDRHILSERERHEKCGT
jgi:hypothetical protein